MKQWQSRPCNGYPWNSKSIRELLQHIARLLLFFFFIFFFFPPRLITTPLYHSQMVLTIGCARAFASDCIYLHYIYSYRKHCDTILVSAFLTHFHHQSFTFKYIKNFFLFPSSNWPTLNWYK